MVNHENSFEKKLFTSTFMVFICAIICNALWGSAFPAIKLGYEMFSIKTVGDKILFAGLRFMLAGIMVIVFNSILHKRMVSPKNKEDIYRVLKLCIFQTVLQYVFFYIGLSNTTGVKASIIEGSNVFIAIIIGAFGQKMFHLQSKEKITWRIILGCLIGFAGVIIVNITPEGFDSAIKLTGEGFIFLSTFAYGCSTVLIKKYAMESDTIMLSGWQFFMGGVIMTSIGLIGQGTLGVVTGNGIIMLCYLAMVSAVAYTLWGVLLKYNPVSKIAVFGFLNPVFGVILSAWLLKEGNVLNIKYMVALVFVCIGVYLVNGKTQK